MKLAELLINVKASTGSATKELASLRAAYKTTTDEVKREALAVKIAEKEKELATERTERARRKEYERTVRSLRESAKKAKEYSIKISAPIVAIGALSVKSANDAEQSTRRLQIALKQAGQFSEENLKKLVDLSGRIQIDTGIDDDEIRKTQKYFVQMGFGADQIERLTEGAVGLSVAYDKDLNTSSEALSKAMLGNWSALEKMLPQLKTAGNESERNAMLNRILSDSYDLAKEGQTELGRAIIELTKYLKDFNEEVGKRIIPWLIKLSDHLESALKEFNSLSDGTKTTIVAVGAVAAAIPPLLAVIANLRIAVAGMSAGFVASWLSMERVVTASKIGITLLALQQSIEILKMSADGLDSKIEQLKSGMSEQEFTENGMMVEFLNNLISTAGSASEFVDGLKQKISESNKVFNSGSEDVEKYAEALNAYEAALEKIARQNDLDLAVDDGERLRILAEQMSVMDDLISKKKELADAGESDENVKALKEVTELTRQRFELLSQGRSIYASMQEKEAADLQRIKDKMDREDQAAADAWDAAEERTQEQQERADKERADKEKDLKARRSEFEIETKIAALRNSGDEVGAKSLEIQRDVNSYVKEYGYSVEQALSAWKAINKQNGKADYSEKDKEKAQEVLDRSKDGKQNYSKRQLREAKAIVEGKAPDGGSFKSEKFRNVRGRDSMGDAYNLAFGKLTKKTGSASFSGMSELNSSSKKNSGDQPAPEKQNNVKPNDGLSGKFDELIKEFRSFTGKFEQAFSR